MSQKNDYMIKMMLTVVVVYTVSWLPLNIFNIYGDLWPDNLYEENRHLTAIIYPFIHFLAMSHSVWNPLIYGYMNSRFRDSFRTAISNVPCLWKVLHFCHLRCWDGTRDGGRMGGRSFYTGTSRWTRTNTSCTTYTFGSGSLHNLHMTSIAQNCHNHYALQNHHGKRKSSGSCVSSCLVTQCPSSTKYANHHNVIITCPNITTTNNKTNKVTKSKFLENQRKSKSCSSPRSSSSPSESELTQTQTVILPKSQSCVSLQLLQNHNHHAAAGGGGGGHGVGRRASSSVCNGGSVISSLIANSRNPSNLRAGSSQSARGLLVSSSSLHKRRSSSVVESFM